MYNRIILYMFIRMMASENSAMILFIAKKDRACKLKISSRTASVDALVKIIKEQMELDLRFTLHYEDRDFDEN